MYTMNLSMEVATPKTRFQVHFFPTIMILILSTLKFFLGVMGSAPGLTVFSSSPTLRIIQILRPTKTYRVRIKNGFFFSGMNFTLLDQWSPSRYKAVRASCALFTATSFLSFQKYVHIYIHDSSSRGAIYLEGIKYKLAVFLQARLFFRPRSFYASWMLVLCGKWNDVGTSSKFAAIN